VQREELVDTIGRLRRFAVRHNLQWVLDEVDEAISLGVVEVKELRQSNRRGEIVYEELVRTDGPGVRGRRRAEEFLSRRPLTPLEEATALVAALRRVLVTLDEVATASVSQLNGLPVQQVDGRSRDFKEAAARLAVNREEKSLVTEIDFLPDDGALDESITTEAMRHQNRQVLVLAILDDIDRMIRA
jgi:hypothetical protein